jgi:uncharacterized membrane protein
MSDEENLKAVTMFVYVMQALGFLFGLTWVVGVIVNYVKKREVAGSWLESHFRWQIRTFWFGLLWVVVGTLLLIVFGLGYLVWSAAWIWAIYRVVKGWLYLNDRKALPVT